MIFTLYMKNTLTTKRKLKMNKFDIEEYQKELFSDEFRKKQIETLTNNYLVMKSIERDNIAILKTFSDPERNEKLVGVVGKVWNGVLDTDTETSSIDDIVLKSLENNELVDFLNDHKNKNYFPSGTVFDNHKEHPEQKLLVKGKYMGKRDCNKQKTPMQTIKYVYKAKSEKDRDERLANIEKSLADAHYMISLLAVNQCEINNKMLESSLDMQEVRSRLEIVEKEIKDERKVKLYAIYTSKKDLKISEMACEIGVSVRTVKYWLKELRNTGFIE